MVISHPDDPLSVAVAEIDDRIVMTTQHLRDLQTARQSLVAVMGVPIGPATCGSGLPECPLTPVEMRALSDERLIGRRIAELSPNKEIHVLTTVRHIRAAGCSERSENALRTWLSRYMDDCPDWSSSDNGKRTLLGNAAEADEMASAAGQPSAEAEFIGPTDPDLTQSTEETGS